MESQIGMSPKLSPAPLKMLLPRINCCDSKTKRWPQSLYFSFLLPQDPFPWLCLPLHTPSASRSSLSLGTLRHADLIRVCLARQPYSTVTDEGEGGLINVRGFKTVPWLIRARAISQQPGMCTLLSWPLLLQLEMTLWGLPVTEIQGSLAPASYGANWPLLYQPLMHPLHWEYGSLTTLATNILISPNIC